MATEQNSDRDKSLSELVKQMTDQSSGLARMEVELAALERLEVAVDGGDLGCR